MPSNDPAEQPRTETDNNANVQNGGSSNAASSQTGFLAMSRGLQQLADDEDELDLEELETQSADPT